MHLQLLVASNNWDAVHIQRAFIIEFKQQEFPEKVTAEVSCLINFYLYWGTGIFYRIYSRLKYVHSYPNIWYYKKALLLLCRAEGQANTIRK